MHLKKIFCLFLAGSFFLGSCAKKADQIAPMSVSPIMYDNLDCRRIRKEMIRVSHEVAVVTGQQNSAATKDTVALTVGLVLFWPALFFMAGGDKAAELSRLKGEYEALRQAAIDKGCDVAREIDSAEENKKKEKMLKEPDKKNVELEQANQQIRPMFP
ncbi:MAG: hypothetical protein CSA42_07690 [Gammaproteobacteria bacterium]|nr:MAG: hypothetical protein CSA42_07690 [Gammaproteobacteria bacterium]